jgi:nucleoid DNA-binding protein
MTKSELIDQLAEIQRHLAHLDVELGVKSILEQMSAALASGDRIEIRGFGRGWEETPRQAKRLHYPASTCRISSRAKHFASVSTIRRA